GPAAKKPVSWPCRLDKRMEPDAGVGVGEDRPRDRARRAAENPRDRLGPFYRRSRQGQRPTDPGLALGSTSGGRGDHPLQRRPDRLWAAQERPGGRGRNLLRQGALLRCFQAELDFARGNRRRRHKRRLRERPAGDNCHGRRRGRARAPAHRDTTSRV
ncbi:MAG: hypothetical protein AVDCRST_MAG58-3458, partial [uncultured Rubrobacteraceae bacterium]